MTQDAHNQELIDRFIAVTEALTRYAHVHRLQAWEAVGLTIPQLRTLALLDENGPMRMGSISAQLDRALSATTIVVDRLTERDLVVRISDPDDRRVVICELTEAGRETVNHLWRINSERIGMILSVLDVEKMEMVVEGLELLQDAEIKLATEMYAKYIGSKEGAAGEG